MVFFTCVHDNNFIEDFSLNENYVKWKEKLGVLHECPVCILVTIKKNVLSVFLIVTKVGYFHKCMTSIRH